MVVGGWEPRLPRGNKDFSLGVVEPLPWPHLEDEGAEFHVLWYSPTNGSTVAAGKSLDIDLLPYPQYQISYLRLKYLQQD